MLVLTWYSALLSSPDSVDSFYLLVNRKNESRRISPEVYLLIEKIRSGSLDLLIEKINPDILYLELDKGTLDSLCGETPQHPRLSGLQARTPAMMNLTIGKT